MAYALGFPRDITDLIYEMRDFSFKMVGNGGKTPSASCLNWHTDDMWEWVGYKGTTMGIVPRIGMPYYAVESDPEDLDYGEIVLYQYWPWEEKTISIDRYNPLMSFTLRGPGGESPPKFIEFQIQDERRIHDMAFQCEPCEP